MPQPTCPACGMQQSEWLGTDGEGYLSGGQRYCCQGCAQGTGCVCRVANPGVEVPDGEGDAAASLMTPRDRNGRPLDPAELAAREARGEPVQLEDTRSRRASTPAENPRTSTTN